MSYDLLVEYAAKNNIAEDLDEQFLNKIGLDVVEGYNRDVRSRSEWEDKNEEYLTLAAQVVEPKNFPWPNAANVKYPLLTTAAMAYSARAYPALVPGPNIVKGRVVGHDQDGSKAKRAINVGKHMSYQLLEEMEDWEEEMDRICILTPIVGSAFKKTYFNPLTGKNTSDLVLPQDLVIDYYAKSVEKASRKTHKLFLSENDIYERVAAGLYLDRDVMTPQSHEDTSSIHDDLTNLSEPGDTDNTTPGLVLEQHTFYDVDGDGYAEPYIITVDYKTGRVLRIVARYDVEGIQVGPKGDVFRVEPVEYFTKFGFVPNPESAIYDLGFGLLLSPISHTIDTTINQLLDAGTLSNMQSGFLGRGIRLRAGDHRFKPGEWKSVNAAGEDLRKGIVPLPIAQPSNVLFSLLSLMIDAGRRLSSTVDAMTGEDSGQNQKATTTLEKIREGSRVFNSIYKRQHRALKKEFKKLFRLNTLYLEDEQYFTVLDPGAERAEVIRRSDYQDNFADVVPVSDPNVATEQQRLAKAMALLDLLGLGTINPQVATLRILEAQDQYGIEQLMQLPPQQPPFEQVLQEAEFNHKRALDTAEQNRKVIETKFNGIHKLAQAESLEKGDQLGIYKQMLDVIAATEATMPVGGNNVDQRAGGAVEE